MCALPPEIINIMNFPHPPLCSSTMSSSPQLARGRQVEAAGPPLRFRRPETLPRLVIYGI